MWKKIILTIIISIQTIAMAQTNCPGYNEMILKGQKSLLSNKLNQAQDDFKSAKAEGRLCHLTSMKEADKGLENARKAIDELGKVKGNARKMQDSLVQVNRKLQEKIRTSLSTEQEKEKNTETSSQIATGDLNPVNYTSKLNFYLTAKRVLDSINILAKDQNNSFINTQDNEAFMTAIRNRLDSDYNNVIAKFLLDSSKTELTKPNRSLKDYNLLVYTYTISAGNYSYRLIKLKQFELARKTLDEASKFIGSLAEKSAMMYSEHAFLQNVYRYYYSALGKYDKAYDFSRKSIQNISTAISLNANNSIYQRALSIYLRNTSEITDSLLSNNDKQALTKLGCQCATNMLTYFPKQGASLESVASCALAEADEYDKEGKYTEAITLLQSALAKVNQQINYTPNKKDVYLQKSRLQIKISGIYSTDPGDYDNWKIYLDSAIVNWLQAFKNEADPIVYFDQAKYVYQEALVILDVREELEKSRLKEKEQVNEKFIAEISKFSNIYLKQKSILFIISRANEELGKVYESKKIKSDSIKALDCFTKSIEVFEKENLIDGYDSFSEEISKFCSAYRESIIIYLSLGEYKKAIEVYDKMTATFSNYYYKKYPWDFYFVWQLRDASSQVGNYLYKSNQSEKAIPALSLASYEGDKLSSQQLVDIYGNANSTFYDTASLHKIQTRIKYQSSEVQSITLLTKIYGIEQSFTFYIVDRDPEHLYKGIDDQVEWVRRARGGEVSKGAVEALIQLQLFAWKDNESFGQVTVNTINSIREESAIKKYQPLKDSIELNKDDKVKLSYYKKLYSRYEYDIRNSENYIAAIKKNAVIFYNQYARFLIKKGQTNLAQQIIKRVHELDEKNYDVYENEKRMDYVRNKDGFLKSSANATIPDLELYLGFYLEDLDFKKASVLTKSILERNDSIYVREEISEIYYRVAGYSNFEELFLKDTNKLASYYEYFNMKYVDYLSNEEKRNFYFNLIDLDKAFMKINKADSIRTQLSNHYNALAWYSIFTKQYDQILYYLNKSMEFDPTSVYPYGNIPHVYLFTNNFDKAKELYMKFKDRPFDKARGYATFKDAFLGDFSEFTKAGIENDNMKAIENLLNEK